MLGKMSRRSSWVFTFLIVILGVAVFGFLAGAGEAEARKLKILCTTDLSGPLATFGASYDRALKLAIADIEKVGIKGFDGIDYKIVDDEGKPSTMQRKLQREAETWKPDIVVGAVWEPTIRVWCSELPKYKIPGYVGGHQGMSKHMGEGPVPLTGWVMYYGFPEYYSGYLGGKTLHDLGAKRVAFMAADYDWGWGQSQGLLGYWLDNGKPFEIIMIGYTPPDKSDYTTETLLIKEAKADGMYCPYTGAGWWTLPKALRDAQAMPAHFVYECSYGNQGQARISGEYGAEGVYTVADHDPTRPEWAEFVKKWQAAYGEKSFPEMYTSNYYQATWWAAKAFEQIGPDNKDPDRALQILHQTSFQNVNVGPMGPLDEWGGNVSAKGSVIRFVKGASELDPNFGLHEELIKVYDLPKWNSKELLEKMSKMPKLERGQKYEAAQ